MTILKESRYDNSSNTADISLHGIMQHNDFFDPLKPEFILKI
ncbi:hypothetical protein EM6_0828 [Asticcacaulis excentricus]|uniref:Uncharacterized protein n=1 Tax=Asticcacaulis excentricus TaxID=78587 RepID=A0A3G9G7J9_9CAUL|nr:hypothetical protein EM6_0828 [Asticcacaulis excentricus]